MDKEKLENDIRDILYATINQGIIEVANKLAESVEIDGAKILNLCLATKLTEHEACELTKAIVKENPIKIKETSDEQISQNSKRV